MKKEKGRADTIVGDLENIIHRILSYSEPHE